MVATVTTLESPNPGLKRLPEASSRGLGTATQSERRHMYRPQNPIVDVAQVPNARCSDGPPGSMFRVCHVSPWVQTS